jgi:hypothetical protein
METIRGIYKKNRRNGTLFGFSVSTEIKVFQLLAPDNVVIEIVQPTEPDIEWLRKNTTGT